MEAEKNEKYKNISLPSELKELIENIMTEHPELGYKTVTEFVKEAIRIHINNIENRPLLNRLNDLEKEKSKLLKEIEKIK